MDWKTEKKLLYFYHFQLGIRCETMGPDGESARKSVDKRGCICYIENGRRGGAIQVEAMILKEALQGKSAETARVTERFCGEAPAQA